MSFRVLVRSHTSRGPERSDATTGESRAGLVNAHDQPTATHVTALAGYRVMPAHVVQVGSMLMVAPATPRATDLVHQYVQTLSPTETHAPVREAAFHDAASRGDHEQHVVTAAMLMHELHERTEARISDDPATTQQQRDAIHHRVQHFNRQEIHHDDQIHE